MLTVASARAVTQEANTAAEEPAAPLFSSPPANVLVMHGNILYDWSQVCAAAVFVVCVCICTCMWTHVQTFVCRGRGYPWGDQGEGGDPYT